VGIFSPAAAAFSSRVRRGQAGSFLFVGRGFNRDINKLQNYISYRAPHPREVFAFLTSKPAKLGTFSRIAGFFSN